MTAAVSGVWETQIQVPPSKLLVQISLVYTKCQIKLAQSLKKLCGMLIFIHWYMAQSQLAD